MTSASTMPIHCIGFEDAVQISQKFVIAACHAPALLIFQLDVTIRFARIPV